MNTESAVVGLILCVAAVLSYIVAGRICVALWPLGVVWVYEAQDGYRWHAISRNNRKVAEGGEAFETRGDARRSAKAYGPYRYRVQIKESR